MGNFMSGTSIASQPLASDTIAKASSQNRAFFFVYMTLVLGSVVLAYLLWRSGNKVQDAIVADANARIGAVSYTHLDVYKRQDRISMMPLFNSQHRLLLAPRHAKAQQW